MVMNEIGVGISLQRSKSSEGFTDTILDLAVTVCDKERQACPISTTKIKIPSRSAKARKVIHKSFEDPALAASTNEEQINIFRGIRDDIKERIIDAVG